jgi:plastocyanin
MKEFRERVLLPLLVPLSALLVIVIVVLNFSRVLLALEERSGPQPVVVLAVIVSSAVLFTCTYISARGEERSTGNLSVLAGAGVVLVIAGFVGFAAIQETEHAEAAKGAEEGGAVAGPPDVVIVAFDLGFRPKEAQAAAGKIKIQNVNEGATAHTFVFDGVAPGFKLSVPSKGDKDMKAVELEAGTYTFFCDIPGHRQAGMEGKLTVTPGGAGAEAGGAGAAVTAGDLFFNPKEIAVPAGPVPVSMKNDGKVEHTLVVEEAPKFKKLVVEPGRRLSTTPSRAPSTSASSGSPSTPSPPRTGAARSTRCASS